MKVALLLTGGVRIFEDTYHSIKHHIIDSLGDVDVFIYGLENKLGKESNIERLTKLYSPKRIIINDKDFYIENKVFDETKLDRFWHSAVCALYNVKKANELKREYQEITGEVYDLVIRIRMDHFWIRTPNTKEIEFAKDHILLGYDFAFKSVNPFAQTDFYCITNENQFDFYSKAYDHYYDYTHIFSFHAESFLGYYLKDQKIYECHRHINTEYPLIGDWPKPLYNAFNHFDENGIQVHPLVSDIFGQDKIFEIPEKFYSPKVWKYPEDFPDYTGDPVHLRHRLN
jgi:hypothetical protein